MNIGKIIFISTWFGIGFLIMFCVWISDMRNKEFDKNYFDILGIFFSLLILLFGYISLVIATFIYCYNNRPFTKLVYKIANIGIKHKEI